MSLLLKALIAGAFFGAWPLILSKSGLSGNISALSLLLVNIFFVAPFAAWTLSHNPTNFAQVDWIMVLVAGIVSGIALLCINNVATQAHPQNLGTLLTLAVLVQVAVPALYTVVLSGTVSAWKATGFVLAGLGAAILVRS